MRRATDPRHLLLLAGCVLIAANLRPALTAVGPLVIDIRASTGVSAATAGLLITLPLLTFAGTSPLASRAARRFGVERALLGGLVALVAGVILRSTGPLEVTFAGTMVLGTGVAVGNVLLPSLVKQHFPDRVGAMTSVYATAIAAMAAVGAATSVPLAHAAGLGWRGALGCWAALAACALVVWLPTAYEFGGRLRSAPPRGHARLRRSALAWQLTAFMGLQSLIFYATVAWLPTLLVDDGLSHAGAGWLLGLLQLGSLAGTMSVPILVGRDTDQRRLVLAGAAACLLGLLGLLSAGTPVGRACVLPLGVGMGAFLGLALTFLALRAPDAGTAAALSGMAQSVGYLVAAAGPVGLGFLHDATGSWTAPLLALVGVTLGALATGLGASRDLEVA